MSIAEKLLMARDLEGCKQFVAEARSADPRAPGADDLFAAADALLAARRIWLNEVGHQLAFVLASIPSLHGILLITSLPVLMMLAAPATCARSVHR